MSKTWYQDAIISVYSRVSAIATSKLKSKYSSLVITDDDSKLENPKFPTIYIHNLQPYERGQDLEGETINAISLTFQVEVYTKDKVTANEVDAVIIDAFKSMKFQATMPEFQNNYSGVKRTVSRFTRIIGNADHI